MKIGLLARAEDRGIGIQTWEFARHLGPERTLVVDMGPLAKGFTMHLERYPGAEVVAFDGVMLPKDRVMAWLEGLDVLYMVETPYDFRLFEWARQVRCATVVHVNPEFWKWQSPDTPRPDAFWAPTSWRLDLIDAPFTLVPVPVATDRFAAVEPEEGGVLRLVHPAGHRAAMDRAGTQIVLQALRSMRSKVEVVVASQDQRLPAVRRGGGQASVELRMGGSAYYWDTYSRAQVALLPRRYGGLCLPAQEAAAAGCALVMSHTEPNEMFPALYVEGANERTIQTPGGQIEVYDASPQRLATLIDRLAGAPELMATLRAASLTWAQRWSWTRLAGTYLSELERVAGR